MGLGKGTIILDVFGKRETERIFFFFLKGQMKFFKINLSPFLQLGINIF